MFYRALRTEGHVAAGNGFTGDLEKGVVYSTTRGDGHPYVGKDAAEYLVQHDLLEKVDKGAEDNPWFDSEEADRNGGHETDLVHGPFRNVHRMDHSP